MTHSLFASWVAIMSTWVPPFVVAMELANETCFCSPSESANAISQRLLTTSWTIVGFATAPPPAFSSCAAVEALTYISTYYRKLDGKSRRTCLNVLIFSLSLLRKTLISLTVPAMSYTRLDINANVSSSMAVMPNLCRSGVNVIFVYSSPLGFGVI